MNNINREISIVCKCFLASFKNLLVLSLLTLEQYFQRSFEFEQRSCTKVTYLHLFTYSFSEKKGIDNTQQIADAVQKGL